jgi:ubiquinone/menaquinone biosynthesis C-methylase UbiE
MQVINIYDKLKPFVGTCQGLGILDDDTHIMRLNLAAGMLRRYRARSLLDVGCGYGDLRMMVVCERYTGIDINDWMIEEAHYRLPVTHFRTVALEDMLPDPTHFDTVAALGVLNTVPPEQLSKMLTRLGRHASRLLCVSFLTGPQEPDTGVYSHTVKQVTVGQRVLEQGEAMGETTVLIDLRR